MTDTYDPNKTRTTIARRLTRIWDLYLELHWQAEASANDPDFPGGRALNMLAGATIPQDWQTVYDYLEHQHTPDLKKYADAQTAEDEHPISVLGYWTRTIRDHRHQPTHLDPTVDRELDYLRAHLDWITQPNPATDAPAWPQVLNLTADLTTLVRRMESVLHMGTRADRVNARCRHCTEAPRLCLRRGDAKDGSQDHWYCPNKDCRHVYDTEGVARCWRSMLVDRGDAPEWLTISAAASALARSPWSIRDWTQAKGNRKPKVETKTGDDGVLLVRWSDVRATDEATRRRGKYRRTA